MRRNKKKKLHLKASKRVFYELLKPDAWNAFKNLKKKKNRNSISRSFFLETSFEVES